MEDHYDIEELGHFSGQGSHVYTQMKTENGDVFPDFKGFLTNGILAVSIFRFIQTYC
jgi:hypothetical protein